MSTVELLGVFGDDLMVANMARISLSRWHTELNEADKRLIRRLAADHHDSPFYHPKVQFRITVPYYIARQLGRHHVGLDSTPEFNLDFVADENEIDRNEVSRRYTNLEPEFEIPQQFRLASTGGNRQVSAGDADEDRNAFVSSIVTESILTAKNAYQYMIAQGIAPEMARIVLPVCTLTSWVWTGSIYAFAKLCKDRIAEDAQPEARAVALPIAQAVEAHFPVSWPALLEGQFDPIS